MEPNQPSKPKVFFVITKSNWGGAGRYVYDLATHISDEFDVTVLAGGQGLLAQRTLKRGIRYVNVPGLERDIGLTDFDVMRNLKKIFETEQPDIVHLNSSKIGVLGSLAAKRAGIKKIIFTAHGWAFNEKRNIFWKSMTYIGSWFTALFTTDIVTLSYKEELQALALPFISSNKVHNISLGLGELELYEKHSAKEIITSHTNLTTTEQTIWLGSIGELHRNKGFDFALDVCKYLKEEGKDFVYIILGEGEERKTLEQKIEKLELTNHVFLPGALPDSSTASTLLCAFDIFLLPSRKEGLPYVLLEASLAKLAIVASNVGGISELIKHQETGFLIRPETELDLKQAIEALFYDERIRRDYGEKVAAATTAQHSLGLMIQETKQLYQS